MITVNKADVSTVEPSAKRVSICAVLTCFNRREKTLQCLEALAANTDTADVHLHAVLVDDGSTDGTAEAISSRYPWVTVVRGNGSLFWCRGMHRAFEIAMRSGHDYYLWLNDDTVLYPDALSRLIVTEVQLQDTHGKAAIVVGSTVDEATGTLTYGGQARPSRLKPTTFVQLTPGPLPQRCDTMTGNIVLIPASVAIQVGNLDPVFDHAMGDTDYALRARQLGIEVWLGADIFGHCSGNALSGTYRDRSLPLSQRWKQMMSRKGLPWRSWLALTRRHAGPLWALYFAWPYAKLTVDGLFCSRSTKKKNSRPDVDSNASV